MNVQVTHQNGKPCIELRKIVTDTEMIKNIVSHALRDESVVIMPIFIDKVRALSSLMKNGIIYRNKKGGYDFTQ